METYSKAAIKESLCKMNNCANAKNQFVVKYILLTCSIERPDNFATVAILNDSGRTLNSAQEEDTKTTKSLLNFNDKYISTALLGNALIVSKLIDVEVNTRYASKTVVSDVIEWSTSARISSTKLEAEIGRFLPLPFGGISRFSFRNYLATGLN